MRKLYISLLAALFVVLSGRTSYAQVDSFALEPSWVEVVIYAGEATTTGFLIKAPASLLNRGRLQLSLADWRINKAGVVVYKEPGSSKRSAAPWISVYPTDVMIAAGKIDLVRLIVHVPEDAEPGFYRSAVLVGENPTMAPTKFEGESIAKFFQPFTIYLTVRPPTANHRAELSLHK
jgi:hypothetical protein